MQKKSRKSKCALCGESFEKEELTLKSGKKYCANCLIIKEEESLKNKSDWDLLFEYICSIYKIKVPTGMMFSQLKQYRQDYNYTNTGMYYTLKYFYEILESKVLEDSGLGIIPYFYDKAKRHYNKVFDIQDMAENFEDKEQTIQIKTKIIDKSIETKKPLPLNINWEGIDENN